MGHEKIPCSRSFFSHPLALSWQRFAKSARAKQLPLHGHRQCPTSPCCDPAS